MKTCSMLFTLSPVVRTAGGARVGGVERPGEVGVAAGVEHPHVKVIDQGGVHIGRAGGVVPRGGHPQLGVLGPDDDHEAVDAALADLGLDDILGDHGVHRVDGPDGTVAELIVRPGVAAVLGGVGQDGLERAVAQVRPVGERQAVLLEDQGGDARGGRRGHGGAAQRGVAA
jgi:hypothetical protein